MQQIYLESSFKSGYRRLMKYISNIAHFDKKIQKTIYDRIETIEFFEQFSLAATKKAFKVSKSTIFSWKQKLKKSGGKLSSLAPKSKAPKIRSKRKIKQEHLIFVEQYRKQHPGVSKDTIKPTLDAIEIFINSVRRYIITAIDVKVRFGFAYSYKSLLSNMARDFMSKLIEVAPFKIKRIQTDNGKEFHKHFRDYIKKQKIIHFFNYPRQPKMNSYVKRFNRTIQEQFVSWHMNDLYEPEEFNPKLMKYLIWYNSEKPHKSLNKISPLQYYLNNYILNVQKSNMLWTSTFT